MGEKMCTHFLHIMTAGPRLHIKVKIVYECVFGASKEVVKRHCAMRLTDKQAGRESEDKPSDKTLTGVSQSSLASSATLQKRQMLIQQSVRAMFTQSNINACRELTTYINKCLLMCT